jgi:hypothetical protein
MKTSASYWENAFKISLAESVWQLLAHALLSRMAVSLKENNCFFVTDQTPRPAIKICWHCIYICIFLWEC